VTEPINPLQEIGRVRNSVATRRSHTLQCATEIGLQLLAAARNVEWAARPVHDYFGFQGDADELATCNGHDLHVKLELHLYSDWETGGEHYRQQSCIYRFAT
jgi:hypothetical protein